MALINGILDSGVNVISLGLVTTPMFYYACILKKQTCGIMVTASHNPKDENGFKFSLNEYTNARGEMIEDFRDFTLKGKFDKGNGTLYSYDIRKEYIGLVKHAIEMGEGKIKVVVDPGNNSVTYSTTDPNNNSTSYTMSKDGNNLYIEKDGELVRLYERIVIRKKQQS